ncbi:MULTISPECIES: GTP cyclohydrolase II [unclassified Photobacterium]|uniref:GTP cyclohydrolase II n=1 Tax=unclassified Photobacterium TaxID=2628852 RepID=UPI000D161AE7|nr:MULTISPECIES: GTP cyclohydrolase II [unclassified Photobacterium]PSV26347.1 GTP cyclohydrolase [Photobacterium sp. GB-56]PSV31538.1 GTP cyclohydrolase [Photobacterium sp. GB-72]PSV33794.1 GTP cyclohydrolase [Photobacterium sp. GB-27]PSV36825.1 GTP cyclohydrolase [Photobacterium sp. GB-210]PSV46076.1 GTP cyclohydrolase [Photobacterium sp. GB-36]
MVTVRARVPFKIGQRSDIPAELLSFHGFNSGKEHVAIIFKQADTAASVPLVRLHSECLTGDVFHSSRCDCGEQLNETIEKMRQSGGILLYLRQEGRGIGLYNKLDAYQLQSQGMNTYEANNHLGFDDDLRDFKEAADALHALGINKVRLITNNPKKVKDLSQHNIQIVEVIKTQVHIKEGNQEYLQAKALYGHHNLSL